VDIPPKSRGKKARKILAVLIVLILGTVGIYALIGPQFTSRLTDLSDTRIEAGKQTENQTKLAKDSDEDGLKDWEEIFYKTDPQNPDTDGDGTLDGEEVAKNRDPLKAGPGDKLAEPEKIDSATAADAMPAAELLQEAAQKNVNLTDYFVQKFLGSGGLDGLQTLLEPGADQKFSDEFITYIQKLSPYEPFSEKSIPDSGISINNDSNDAAIKNYFNSVAGIYEKYVPSLQGADEMEFLANALEEENRELLDAITPIIEARENIVGDLKKLSAPRTIATLHKQELWYAHKGTEQIKLIQAADPKDAVYALVVMSARIKMRREATEFHTVTIPEWLKARGITFSEDDKAVLLYPSLIQQPQ